MKVCAVIPARYGAVRFPGKPLALIRGRPLIQWVVEGCLGAHGIDEVVVATDDERIAKVARACGVEAVMTPSELPSGSDRVWEAVKDRPVDIVLNVQGDEPLVQKQLLTALALPLREDPGLEMSTLGREFQTGDREAKTTAKIILNERHEALYFSRFPIPYSRIDAPPSGGVGLKHIGLYGFRKSFLRRFCEHGPIPLEHAEGLEQLRALFLGARIKVVRVEHDSWGVDTPEDVEKIERILLSTGAATVLSTKR